MTTELQLSAIAASEARFHGTVEGFTDADLNDPSLCAGWTRGHVIAHVALNAHSIVNLFTWARTGVETPQYPSRAARDADIERYSTRSVDEHLAALEEAERAYDEAARSVPDDRWDFDLDKSGNDPLPVRAYLTARHSEVEIHHVDLLAGYEPSDWPEDFVRRTLERAPTRLGDQVRAPFSIDATDLGLWLTIGEGDPVTSVTGKGHDLLMWLLRSRAEGLEVYGSVLPDVPSWG